MGEGAMDPTELAEKLQLLVGALVRSMRAASPERDITLAQVSMLKRLGREGTRTVAELARADKITHQSAAATVTALVDRGLVRREVDVDDLRRRVLTLTDAGHSSLAERRDAGYGHLAELIRDRLSPHERRQLEQSLWLLERLLDQ
ncbi:MarR family winged helix-turn-helix transcriptional regulator [Nocardia sp. NPDC101769]|uniref:MarR family winged helix-turn-helix transcriptional regulator n=1 Tax=Nocardia sp. NPDC101769 TaxID=3364333 RepID=UPI0037FDAB29